MTVEKLGDQTSPTPGATTPLYPLRFRPIFQYRPWGGRRLASVVDFPLPDGPVGEAWLLSDRPDHQSLVAAGPLAGCSLRQLMEMFPAQMMGRAAAPTGRFPLLLKFLDATEMLSVQVHPSDTAKEYLPDGETGKSEAWVVLQADPGSRIYAGLQPGATRESLGQAAISGTVADQLAWFSPKPGDTVLLSAGTVHTLGGGLVVFEPQENSDVTFRLYDWDRVDTRTGHRRALQVDEAIACADVQRGPVGVVEPQVETLSPVRRERIVDGDHFRMWRSRASTQLMVGHDGEPRIIVCLEGAGQLEYQGHLYPVGAGEIALLPAIVGRRPFQPLGPVTLLEIALPEATSPQDRDTH